MHASVSLIISIQVHRVRHSGTSHDQVTEESEQQSRDGQHSQPASLEHCMLLLPMQREPTTWEEMFLLALL